MKAKKWQFGGSMDGIATWKSEYSEYIRKIRPEKYAVLYMFVLKTLIDIYCR